MDPEVGSYSRDRVAWSGPEGLLTVTMNAVSPVEDGVFYLVERKQHSRRQGAGLQQEPGCCAGKGQMDGSPRHWMAAHENSPGVLEAVNVEHMIVRRFHPGHRQILRRTVGLYLVTFLCRTIEI
jgi:hypothetical protein